MEEQTRESKKDMTPVWSGVTGREGKGGNYSETGGELSWPDDVFGQKLELPVR